MSANPRLYINNAPELDWLIALEFGRVDDAQPPDNWRGVSHQLGFLDEPPDGRCLGFKVLEFSTFDPAADEVAEIWSGPLFDVPLLGLAGVSAGEIVLATRALLGDEPSINRVYFNEAAGADDPAEALALWISCLEAGDSMAHFGLGYTLYALERYQEAYRHLRHYTEIAPCGSWNWCWFGRAAEAVGELTEARRAYERAIELEANGSDETDAAERLAKLAG
jgi:tetratricopeptide (TPR) repeat protein